MEVERRLDELLPHAAWTAEWPSVRYIPWGWTPALVHRLRQEGVEECFLPSEEAVRRFRFLSSRQRCLEVLPELLKIDGTCGEMKACVSLSELEAFLQERGELVLKAPWSGSGRGLLKVSSASWNAQLAGWAARILRVQGAVMAEPIYDKVVDLRWSFMWRSRMEFVLLVILCLKQMLMEITSLIFCYQIQKLRIGWQRMYLGRFYMK